MPVIPLHHDVGNQVLRRRGSDCVQRRLRVIVRNRVEEIHLQDHAHHLGDADFVVDDEDAAVGI